MQRTVTVLKSFKTLQSLRVAFFESTRNFSVSSISNREVKIGRGRTKKNIDSSQNQNTRGPHPAAILAVITIGVSAYIALVRNREKKN